MNLVFIRCQFLLLVHLVAREVLLYQSFICSLSLRYSQGHANWQRHPEMSLRRVKREVPAGCLTGMRGLCLCQASPGLRTLPSVSDFSSQISVSL